MQALILHFCKSYFHLYHFMLLVLTMHHISMTFFVNCIWGKFTLDELGVKFKLQQYTFVKCEIMKTAKRQWTVALSSQQSAEIMKSILFATKNFSIFIVEITPVLSDIYSITIWFTVVHTVVFDLNTCKCLCRFEVAGCSWYWVFNQAWNGVSFLQKMELLSRHNSILFVKTACKLWIWMNGQWCVILTNK